jgi:glutaredoxin
VQRHPVTLYTGEPCPACDTARQLLLQRGLPFSERRISTDEDAVALERLVGARSVPSLTLGSQPLRGFNDADWTRFLDAADDPRQSQLPRNWQAAPTRPLVERSTPATQEPAAPPAGAQPAPAGMRF